MSDERTNYEILWLTYQALEGLICPLDFARLEHRLASDAEARQIYREVVALLVAMNRCGSILPSMAGNPQQDGQVWREVVERDLSDSAVRRAIRLAESDALEAGCSLKPSPCARRPITQRQAMRFLLNSAAILVLCLGALWLDRQVSRWQPQWRTVVGTLTAQVHPQWQGRPGATATGDSIWSGAYTLTSGLVEIQFKGGATAVIEAPADFSIYSPDRVTLYQGRIYSRVPSPASGFTIQTRNAQIIDLGTEFGVWVDQNDTTEAHVFKGEVRLIGGPVNREKTARSLIAGQAGRVDGMTGSVCTIPVQPAAFARQLDTNEGLVWHTQRTLDVADLIAGGPGISKPERPVALDAITGEAVKYHNAHRYGPSYRPLPDHPFLDGLFVPDGHRPQRVSSQGHLFGDCPLTSGVCYADIAINPGAQDLIPGFRNDVIQVDGAVCEPDGPSYLILHANLGLTIDLDAVRKRHPRLKLAAFQARAGIAELGEGRPCHGDLWVLVDGAPKFVWQSIRQKGLLHEVAVPLSESDRFLTLAATDGGDPDNKEVPWERSIDCDWGVFVEPVLALD